MKKHRLITYQCGHVQDELFENHALADQAVLEGKNKLCPHCMEEFDKIEDERRMSEGDRDDDYGHDDHEE